MFVSVCVCVPVCLRPCTRVCILVIRNLPDSTKSVFTSCHFIVITNNTSSSGVSGCGIVITSLCYTRGCLSHRSLIFFFMFPSDTQWPLELSNHKFESVTSIRLNRSSYNRHIKCVMLSYYLYYWRNYTLSNDLNGVCLPLMSVHKLSASFK